jgi:hypothetical protein
VSCRLIWRERAMVMAHSSTGYPSSEAACYAAAKLVGIGGCPRFICPADVLVFAPFCAWPTAIFAQKSTTTKTRLTKALEINRNIYEYH